MRSIATDVTRSGICLSVCALITRICPATTAEPIELPFGMLTDVCPRNHALDGDQERTNPFAAARGVKSSMWPLARLLWKFGHLFFIMLGVCVCLGWSFLYISGAADGTTE